MSKSTKPQSVDLLILIIETFGYKGLNITNFENG